MIHSLTHLDTSWQDTPVPTLVRLATKIISCLLAMNQKTTLYSYFRIIYLYMFEVHSQSLPRYPIRGQSSFNILRPYVFRQETSAARNPLEPCAGWHRTGHFGRSRSYLPQHAQECRRRLQDLPFDSDLSWHVCVLPELSVLKAGPQGVQVLTCHSKSFKVWPMSRVWGFGR